MIGIIIGALLGFFFYGIHRYVADRLFYNCPPGPRPVPFLGNFPAMAPEGKKKTWQVLTEIGRKYFDKYGSPIFTFYFGQVRVLVLNDSKSINEALVSQSKVFSWRFDRYVPGCGHVEPGIIGSNHDEWRRYRRFGMKAMRDFGMGKDMMVMKIQDEVGHFIEEIQRNRTNKAFCPKELLAISVSNVICSFVFGERFNYENKVLSELIHQMEVMVKRPMAEGALFMSLPFIDYFKTYSGADEYVNFQNITTVMVEKAIAEHRKDFDPANIRDFPDLFLQQEKDEEPFDLKTYGLIMSDMFLAGTETTATSLSWTLLYLATWPEIQTKCQQAIDSVIESDRLANLSDRPQLVYIDALMCEILRHTSMVPGSLFHTNLDVPSKIAGYDCPPWTMILYNVYAVQHDERYWGDPEVFRPERWIDENGKLLSHSTHFMPFGIGPRICLGEALARVEYFIFIVAMLQRFNFKLETPIDIRDGSQGGVVHSPPDFPVIITPRH